MTAKRQWPKTPPPRQAVRDLLALLARTGYRPPCDGDKRWISESRRDTAQAVAGCADCQVLAQCRRAGQDEHAGVWGGVHRR